jgi:hypothetical protein
MKIADVLAKLAVRYAASDQNDELPEKTPICVCIYVNPLEPRVSAIAALDGSKQATFADMVEAVADDLRTPKGKSSTSIM